jgi:hypothetical protein
MKCLAIIGTGALAICAYDLARAAHPPLDRPTPPPCCADGICYPNPTTWGVYGTRWRRWPTDTSQLVPAAPAPVRDLGPDIPAYETPRAEDEDRRAPPRTVTPAEEAEAAEPGTAPLTPSGEGGLETPPTTPLTPQTSPLTPQTSPLAPPGTPLTPEPSPLAPPTRMPWEEDATGPTGDWDPPPSLPTATAATSAPQGSLRTMRQTEQAAPRIPTSRPRHAPSNDPPPSLPVSLASATLYY